MFFAKTVFLSPEFIQDPVPILAQFRQRGDLVRNRLPIIGEVWVPTTQAANSQVLKDKTNFTLRKKNGKIAGLQWWMPGILRRLTANMLTNDEPEHTRLRSKVDVAFHRANITALEPKLRRSAEKLANDLFKENPTADLLESFSRRFPLIAICELLGLPAEDQEKFTKWADGLGKVSGVFSFLRAVRGISAMSKYLERRIEHVRKDGGAGLIHDIISVEDGEEPLTKDELLAMVFLLLVAGHETTTHLISGGIFTLLKHPDQLDYVKQDWARSNLAVEEMLRYVSPVQFSKPRFAQRDITVCGIDIKEGEMVMNCLTSANFDPAVFENPEKFDVTRKPNPHISFGSGIHFCLGHQLARLEAKIALETLFTIYPDLNLAVAPQEIKWRSRLGLRALEALPVRAN